MLSDTELAALARAITELAAHPPDEWRDLESDVVKLIRGALAAARAKEGS
jgi:hypothetical protein